MIRGMQKLFYKNPVLYRFFKRPEYAYHMYRAALLAKTLSLPRISVVEFGVAQGNGLLEMEKYASDIEDITGVGIELYGFDTSEGLPELLDYRDLMHNWKVGQFEMDFDGLQKKLARAKLVIGNVKDTLGDFFSKYNPAPIGAVSFDLDLYSSTRAALEIFNSDPQNFLPRVRCYFDDLLGNEDSLTNEYVGEPLAINEFNAENENCKVCRIEHLRSKSLQYKWYYKSYVAHFFNHADYTKYLRD